MFIYDSGPLVLRITYQEPEWGNWLVYYLVKWSEVDI